MIPRTLIKKKNGKKVEVKQQKRTTIHTKIQFQGNTVLKSAKGKGNSFNACKPITIFMHIKKYESVTVHKIISIICK